MRSKSSVTKTKRMASFQEAYSLQILDEIQQTRQMGPSLIYKKLVTKELSPTVLFISISICLLAAEQTEAGALLTNAQYQQVSVLCDATRLIKCQQDAIRQIQSAGSLNSASAQYLLSGPPYSPKSSQQLLVDPGACRLVRSSLDCLLLTTPDCYDSGIQAAQNTDIIHRAKRFLEQNGCNAPDSTWGSTLCYLSPEVRSCEDRYGFNSYSSGSSTSSACLAYQQFKYCVATHLRINCKVHEMDMANEYFIDKASDLSWRCLPNITTTSGSSANYLSPYQQHLSPSSSVLLQPSNYASNYGINYEQRPIPTYVGSSSGSISLFGTNRDQAWEKFRNPFDENRFGISRYPGGSSQGEVFERLIVEAENSDCPIKAAPYARECEDTLLEQQRLARDSRDGNELTRRICCSFYQYRDCLSRVVLDRCADSSVATVELLMGSKRREFSLTCRSFNRDVCSGALAQAVLNLPVLLAATILTSFMTFKQSILAAIQL